MHQLYHKYPVKFICYLLSKKNSLFLLISSFLTAGKADNAK